MNLNKTTLQWIFVLILQWIGLYIVIAQPSDRAFSVVTFDNNGYLNCEQTYYKLYACTVNYPNSVMRLNSLEEVWKPYLKTIKILEPLKCVKITNDSMGRPYSCYFQGNSCLNTNILMIIKNEKDTMFISTGGADAYSLVVSPNGHELGLPFVFPFQKGLFYLKKLVDDKPTTRLYNVVHRNYFLAYYNTNPNFISKPSEAYISYLKMDKSTYTENDILKITLTGKVLNDGSCSGGGILWTLQKFENHKWIIAKENCCMQMDCGKGASILKNATIPLILLKNKINPQLMTHPQQMEIPAGKYRFVVYDDVYQPYWTEEFNIQ